MFLAVIAVAKSICDTSQPPNTSPLVLASAGIVIVLSILLEIPGHSLGRAPIVNVNISARLVGKKQGASAGKK